MADLKVNAGEWNALSRDDQAKIMEIMKVHGFLKTGDRLVPDVSAAATLATGVTTQSVFCKIGCDIAEAAAVAACSALSGPAAGICIAAAHAGGELCRSRC